MSENYSDVVVDNVIGQIIGTRYVNEAKLIAAGLVENQGVVTQGTADEWIRETLFQGSSSGQVVSVGSEFSLKGRSQEKYQVPKFWRGDAVAIDPIFDEISSKAARDMETQIGEAVSKAAGQNLNAAMIAILNGFGAWAKANSENYVADKSSQISFPSLQEAKATRGDQGMFDSGVIAARSPEIHKLYATAQVAATSNTAGAQAQDSVISTGNYVNGTVLGMTLLMDDAIALDSDDSLPFVYLMDRGAFGAKFAPQPKVITGIKDARMLGEVTQYYFSAAAGIKGMSYSGTINDKVSNTDLATGTNWALAATDAKFVPVAVLAVNTTSF